MEADTLTLNVFLPPCWTSLPLTKNLYCTLPELAVLQVKVRVVPLCTVELEGFTVRLGTLGRAENLKMKTFVDEKYQVNQESFCVYHFVGMT